MLTTGAAALAPTGPGRRTTGRTISRSHFFRTRRTNYSWKHPYVYTNQTRWLKENAEKYRIPIVCHEGDIVQKVEPK